MESWVVLSLILCTFSFLRDLRPIDPFVTEYIIEFKNVTAEEVIHIAFPVSTYSSLASLVIFLLITDLVRYKPIVCFEGIFHVLTWGILTLFSGLESVIVVEILYGIACSAEIGSSTYVFAKLDRTYYKQASHYIKSASLAGKFLCGVVAQLLITFNLMNYHHLSYITLTCVCIGTIFTFCLPQVKQNKRAILSPAKSSSKKTSKQLLGVTSQELTSSTRGPKPEIPETRSLRSLIASIISNYRSSYGDSYVLKWSLWWAFASAGQYQVINYIQALWERIRAEEEHPGDLYNGAVKATHTLLSALINLGVGYAGIKWEKWGEATLTIISILQGLLLTWMARTSSLNIAYLTYIVFRTIHPVVIAAANAEIAQRIPNDSYGLIFGTNMFIALSLQTCLTLVVSDGKGLALDERIQYFVYGVCFVTFGLLIGGTFLCRRVFVRTRSLPEDPEAKDANSVMMTDCDDRKD